MDRGLRAQLSPNEEATLTQVMRGDAQGDLRSQDIKYLAALRLIELADGKWRLSLMGATRTANI